MQATDGFIPIVAIFYAVFHPTEGTKIVHQVPEGTISSTHRKAPFKNGDSLSHYNNSRDEILDKQDNNNYDDDLTPDGYDDDYDTSSTSLFNFDTVKNYVIPKPQLCNKLISFKINKFKVVGYPVNIENPKYSRNSFNFNFCFVFPYDLGDVTPYESAILRMGKMFKVLEEQSFILSKLDKNNSFFKINDETNQPNKVELSSSLSSNTINIGIDLTSYHAMTTTTSGNSIPAPIIDHSSSVINTPGHSRAKKITLSSIESLINQIYQDLNNYSECCIPLDSSNSVDIKLFPILPPPVNIKAYQVPIATVKLNSLVDVNWDPTMINILPYINGINSVRRISELANADYMLTKQCIQHLMHYECIEMIDIFQFSNIYAPTNHIGNFLRLGGKMAEDCQAYVVTTDIDIDTPASTTPVNNESPHNTLTPNSSSVFRRPPPIIASTGSVSPFSRQSPLLSRSPKNPNTIGIIHHRTGSAGNSQSHNSNTGNISGNGVTINIKVPSKATLFYLYRSLNQGQTVKEWYIQHKKLLVNIDVRRFINFGVLRGIIYRVHSYPILNSFTRFLEADEYEKYSTFTDVILKKKYHTSHRQKGRSNSFGERNGKTKLSINSDSRLLKTRVNEQTLKTMKTGRRVSFKTGRRPHPLTNDIIVDSDGDEGIGANSEDDGTIRRNSRHRRSSSSLNKKKNIHGRKDINENAVDSSEEDDREHTGADLESEPEEGQNSHQHLDSESDVDVDSDFESQSHSESESHSDSEEELDSDELQEEKNMANLIKMLKGYQNFDSINTELQQSRQDIINLIDSLGSYSIINS